MKVIGKTEEGFICTVTVNEIKSILSVNDSRKSDISKMIGVGTELTFTEALSKLNLIKDLRLTGSYTSLDRLKDAQLELGKAISIVEGLSTPLIDLQKDIVDKGGV